MKAEKKITNLTLAGITGRLLSHGEWVEDCFNSFSHHVPKEIKERTEYKNTKDSIKTLRKEIEYLANVYLQFNLKN